MLEILRRRRSGVPADAVHRAKLRPSGDVLTAERDGVAVLLDLRREVYLGLDEVGTAIWNGVAGGASACEIAQCLAREFDAPYEVVERDTTTFLHELVDRRLVVPA